MRCLCELSHSQVVPTGKTHAKKHRAGPSPRAVSTRCLRPWFRVAAVLEQGLRLSPVLVFNRILRPKEAQVREGFISSYTSRSLPSLGEVGAGTQGGA